MTTLYQQDSQGNMKVWMIEVCEYTDHTDIIVKSGRLNGRLITNTKSISSGKNAGKANATTHYGQAYAEMQSTITAQLRKGYVKDISEAKSSAILGSGIPAPMLAHKYDNTGAQKGSKTLKQLKMEGEWIIVQPKLDGNRCLIKIDNGSVTLHTREGDLMPVQLSHIIDDVKSLVLTGIIDSAGIFILDGELFSNKISFNKLNGLIKRVKVTAQDIEDRKQIKYHIYDVMLSDGYEKRYEFISRLETKNICLIPSISTIATEANIQGYLEMFLSEGHEGLMVRQLGMGYDNKRSWQLMKVKKFEDDEFELIGMEEEARGNFVGAFVLKNKKGQTFKAGASGQSEDEREEMWLHQNKYIGKTATVCYFGLSEYGIPRFPKLKGLR